MPAYHSQVKIGMCACLPFTGNVSQNAYYSQVKTWNVCLLTINECVPAYHSQVKIVVKYVPAYYSKVKIVTECVPAYHSQVKIVT